MSKRIVSMVALVLILALAVSLSGCGSKGENTPKEGTASPKAGETTKPAGEKPADVPDKYDPPIEMSTVTFNYSYPKFDKGDDINNNPWSRYMLETYGIKVNTLWDTSTDYDQKVNLMIASGNIPDFFAVSPTQFKQLYDAGLIEDLTDSYNQYASEGIKSIMKDAGAEVMESATLNGKLMAIPWTGEAQVGVPVLWIRQDWFDALKLSAPKSMNDVLEIAKAFTTQDPDGNKKDDTFGLAMDKDFNLMTGFLNGYHAYKDIWVEDGAGGLAFSGLQPEMKEALAILQDMFKNKQIDPEFGVKDTTKVNESIGSNKLGMIFGNIELANTMQKITPNTSWLPFPVPSIDAEPALMQHPLNVYGLYWVVKKGTKNPEAIYKMLQAWVDLYYDNTSEEIYAKYNAIQGTGYWMNAPIKIYKTFSDVEVYRQIKPLLESKDRENADLSKLTPAARSAYKQILEYEKGNMEFRGRNGKTGLNGSASVIDSYVANNQYKPEAFTTLPTPAMLLKTPNLLKMQYQMISKIILGAPLDEFDKFVEQYKKLGGDEITAEVNEWYKNK
ncbi:extracellular solute-binding protein [Paenibacillus eucommiae]|uniref:Aldouronate transport system substrate-binding protein n=1 Tax=Paenibacillus eucommiae TaxID=1355755 RepID=A0ABS4J9W2_9BACL|nr:extracellular solute-binding protein [Paenibacillus eucommiae]MBP1996618.1 putative aldouronate transport system substrate-binding protein [Paenibacillus eucommiae]